VRVSITTPYEKPCGKRLRRFSSAAGSPCYSASDQRDQRSQLLAVGAEVIAVGLMVVKNERELDRAPGVVNDPHMPHTAMAYGNRADGRYRPLRDKMKLTLGTDPD
jgi:hypothetical protein